MVAHEGNQSPNPLEVLLQDSPDTTRRFSLVRPIYEHSGVRDALLAQPIQEFRRVLYVPAHLMDGVMYDRLDQAGVPQLPKITLENQAENPAVLAYGSLFGVRDGLKPLAHGALFSRESSETYVSDTEIFTQLGRLYRQVWEATGQIILDADDSNDSPLHHVAIHNFQDTQNALCLSPPYAPEGIAEENLGNASLRFNASLYHELSRRNESLQGGDYANYLATLMDAASQGFDEEL